MVEENNLSFSKKPRASGDFATMVRFSALGRSAFLNC